MSAQANIYYFLSSTTAKTSPVFSFVLLLPGGVFVEDHRVSHNYQQGPGSCQGHIESLQFTHKHMKIKKHQESHDFLSHRHKKTTFSFDKNPMLKSLSIFR